MARRIPSVYLYLLAFVLLFGVPIADDPAVDGTYEYRAASIDPDAPVETASLASLPSVGYTTDTNALWILRRADGGGISAGPINSPEGRAARLMSQYDYVLVVDPERSNPVFYEVIVELDEDRYRLDSQSLTSVELLRHLARDLSDTDARVARLMRQGTLVTTEPLTPALVEVDGQYLLIRRARGVAVGLVEGTMALIAAVVALRGVTRSAG